MCDVRDVSRLPKTKPKTFKPFTAQKLGACNREHLFKFNHDICRLLA